MRAKKAGAVFQSFPIREMASSGCMRTADALLLQSAGMMLERSTRETRHCSDRKKKKGGHDKRWAVRVMQVIVLEFDVNASGKKVESKRGLNDSRCVQ